MIYNTAHVGLILIGASEFPPLTDDTNRMDCHRSYEAMRDYFVSECKEENKNRNKGFGIPKSNMKDLFDSKNSAQDQMDEIMEFITYHDGQHDGKPKFKQLFFYAVTHGVKAINPGEDKTSLVEDEPDKALHYYLAVRRSEKDNVALTYINFSKLFERICEVRGMKLFFIIDACDSGILHQMPTLIDCPEPPEPFVVRDEDEGIVFLTSDSNESAGLVEGGAGGSLTPFTNLLDEILQGGVEEDGQFGLTFDMVNAEFRRRCKERQIGCFARVSNHDWIGSGRYKLLSTWPVFPNNHPVYTERANEVSHIRNAYNQVVKLEIEKNDLSKQLRATIVENRTLKDQKEGIEKENRALKDQNEGIEKENRALKDQNKGIEEENTALKGKSGRRAWLAGILSLAIIVIVTLWVKTK